MKRFLAKIFFRIIGWKCTARATAAVKRSVMIAAPHTSNWDAPIALAAFWIMGVDVRFFIKDDYTRGLWGPLFRALGAIGVDRSPRPGKGHGMRSNKLTDFAIQLLKERDELVVLVPAEGTRQRVDKWRTGFYRIAFEAQVPISLGYLDYAKKEAGIADVFFPSGDFEKDMHHIRETYRPIKGKYPENYNPEIF